MTPIARIRRAIDREWIKAGWSGGQTLRHRLIALAPLLILALPALLVETFSYVTAVVFVISGACLAGVVTLWIEGRRMAGTGAFSSKRSERFVRRSQSKRAGEKNTPSKGFKD